MTASAAASGASDVLVILAGEDVAAPMAWRRVDARSGEVVDGGGGDQTPPSASPRRTILVLPGSEGQVRRLDTPARTEAQARAAAEFQFQGTLAGVDRAAYAVGAPINTGGARLAAATDKARMLQWLDRCRELGSDPRTVLLDFTVWPTAVGEVDILTLPGRLVVAGGELGGFAIESQLAKPVLARWLSSTAATVSTVNVWNGDPQAFAGMDISRAPQFNARRANDLLSELARAAVAAPDVAPNLRQGAFEPAGHSLNSWKLWRLAAALAVAAVLLQVVQLSLHGWRDQQAAREVLASAEQSLRTARPDLGRITNLTARVRALSNALDQASTHPVLSVSDPLFEALRGQPGARLDGLRHDGGAPVVARISAPDAAAFGRLRDALTSQGIDVSGAEPVANGERFYAEWTIRKR